MRKGLGHSEPFGKRKPQTYLRAKPKPASRTPVNIGFDMARMHEERGDVRTQRGKRPRRRTTPHTGPYTPTHYEGHNGRGKRVRPGGPTKED